MIASRKSGDVGSTDTAIACLGFPKREPMFRGAINCRMNTTLRSVKASIQTQVPFLKGKDVHLLYCLVKAGFITTASPLLVKSCQILVKSQGGYFNSHIDYSCSTSKTETPPYENQSLYAILIVRTYILFAQNWTL